MPMVPGLVSGLRQIAPEIPEVQVEVAEGVDLPQPETDANLLEVEHEDGSITISMDGKPVNPVESEAERAADWFRNLVDEIDPGELQMIASDLLRGIDDDIESRNDWIEDRAQGLKLLGLKIEIPGLNGGADGAPVEGMSKVRHPLLLEAVLRFQANARSELLPTDGPVKIRNDAVASTLEQDGMATALQKDFNHYLTSIAKEYYPDTDRMLFMLGFGGTSFKKVYFCPLRGRPVSESVDADDLIVNQAATDLSNAKRITHRTFLRPSTVKRLQILGVYRDVDLSTPRDYTVDSVQREKSAQQGISATATNPDDRVRTGSVIGGWRFNGPARSVNLALPASVYASGGISKFGIACAARLSPIISPERMSVGWGWNMGPGCSLAAKPSLNRPSRMRARTSSTRSCSNPTSPPSAKPSRWSSCCAAPRPTAAGTVANSGRPFLMFSRISGVMVREGRSTGLL